MTTRIRRSLVVLSIFSTSIVAWPSSSSAQVLEACEAVATLDTLSQYTVTVQGTASYSCAKPKILITVTGCLLLNGLPVDCAEELVNDGSSASVDLSFPCLPGVWEVVAIGTGADRALPAVGVAEPQVVPLCDPMDP